MITTYRIPLIVSSFLIIGSCNSQSKKNQECNKNFKLARELAYKNPERNSALDSSLRLINQCMQCDSIKSAVVDFKITLFISMKKYMEGLEFVNTLTNSDFKYEYKKFFIYKGIQALFYQNEGDTIRRNLKYKEIVSDIEYYIKNKTLADKEFNEIYIDLFSIKENYLSSEQINKEVNNLKKLYPAKKNLFDYFIK